MTEKYQHFPQETSSFELKIPETKPPVSIKYIGAHRILKRKGSLIIWTLGPHWPCFIFMFTLLALVSLFSIIFISPKYPPFIILLSIMISIIELLAYSLTALTNPGIIIPLVENMNDTNNEMLCSRCHAVKVKGSFHCRDCDCCIKEWDHHCLWTGKCIGEGNICYFYGFLAWTILFMSYHLSITLGAYKEI